MSFRNTYARSGLRVPLDVDADPRNAADPRLCNRPSDLEALRTSQPSEQQTRAQELHAQHSIAYAGGALAQRIDRNERRRLRPAAVERHLFGTR